MSDGGTAQVAGQIKVGSSQRLDPKVWRIIGVVILGPFMTQMDSTIVNVSLSSIRQDLQASLEASQWIISAYLLALALMLPLNGWLVDRLGAKRLYLGCFSAFTLASLMCGAAHSMPVLIGARVLQGVAGGLLAPLTQLMVARVAGSQMARVMGYAASPILLAPLLGPLAAGVILKYASWPWLFFVNLPVGIVAVILAAIVIPHDEIAKAQKRPFDILGFSLISPGLACLLYGFEQSVHHDGSAFLVAGAALVGAFIWHARRQKSNALIDLELFKIRIFFIGTMTQFFSNGIIYSGQFLIPLYLITGCGMSASEAGWILAPMGLGMMCIYPLMGRITDRFGCRAVASSGILLNFVGTLPFLWMAEHEFVAWLAIACLFLRGVGQGATGIPSISAAYASVPKEKLSFATTATNIVQRLGGPIMTTALAIVMSLTAKFSPAQGSRAFFAPFLALILVQWIVLFWAIRLPLRVEQPRMNP